MAGAPLEQPRTPRWVKAFAIVFLASILLIGILHLTRGGLGGHLH